MPSEFWSFSENEFYVLVFRMRNAGVSVFGTENTCLYQYLG